MQTGNNTNKVLMTDDEALQTLTDKQQQAVMGDTSNLHNS
jgi:hypothetical protein